MARLVRGRYEPLALVGRGGQGRVYRALDHQHDRLVALKVRDLKSHDQRRTLLQEAHVLLALEPHPSLPLVRDDFFVGRRYYIVMDWIEGKTLQSLLDVAGPLPFHAAVRHVRRIAAVLEHLHDHDPPIVHQDVKPANVVLVTARRLALVDFGIAAAAGFPAHGVLGTSGYQAPELGRGGIVTSAADVYGLAATAYALLTTQAPGAARPWDGLERSVRRAFEPPIRRGLATNPTMRPRRARDLVDLLSEASDSLLDGRKPRRARRR